jgi:hypothetical protein
MTAGDVETARSPTVIDRRYSQSYLFSYGIVTATKLDRHSFVLAFR